MLEDGGSDIEHSKGDIKSWQQVQSILVQLVVSIGVAEQRFEFEVSMILNS
jgi:Haspin like kinase domain